MKVWIKAIFLLASKMGALAEAIAQEMDNLSVDYITNTIVACEQMMLLEDKKRRVVNFKVFNNLLKAQLTKDEYKLVKLHVIEAKTFEEIAIELESSKSALSRKFNCIIKTCEEFLTKLTYTQDRLLKEYKDIALVYKMVQKLERQGR